MSKKLLIAAVVAILTFGATMAMATESRVETLGNQGLYLMDDTNIFGNPAAAAYYPKMVKLHMGGYVKGDSSESDSSDSNADIFAYGGGNMTIGKSLTLGVFVARNPNFETEGGIGVVTANAMVTGWPLTAFNHQQWTPDTNHSGIPVDTGDVLIPGQWRNPQPCDVTSSAGTVEDKDGHITCEPIVQWMNPIDIILAYKVGDLAVGISYYLANGKLDANDDIADTEYVSKTRLHSMKVGLSYKTEKIQPELYFHWDPYRAKTKFTQNGNPDITLNEKLTGNKLVFGGRMFYNMSNKVAIVPAIVWEHVGGKMDLSYDPPWSMSRPYGGVTVNYNEGDLGQSYKINSIQTGLSAQYKADKLFLVGSLGLLWSKAVVELDIDNTEFDAINTHKNFAVPVAAMGLEYQATKIMCLRGGINTTTIWASDKVSNEKTELNNQKVVDNSTLNTYQKTSASIGLGLTFGNLGVDMTFGNMFLTGENGTSPGDGPNLFSALDMKYVF
jgi:hypothetical protein